MLREELESTICPACRQLRERYAGGVVEVRGPTWREKAEEVEHTIENAEKVARARNDQERILWKRAFRNGMKYYVSLPELARHIGRVLGRSFKGEVEYHHSTEEPYLRVVWDSEPTEAPRSRTLGKSRHLRKRGQKKAGRTA